MVAALVVKFLDRSTGRLETWRIERNEEISLSWRSGVCREIQNAFKVTFLLSGFFTINPATFSHNNIRRDNQRR